MKKTSPRTILVVSSAASFVSTFSASSTNIALPGIDADLGLGSLALNWVVSAFVLTSAIMVMPTARIGDTLGRQRLFRLGMAIYAAGNLLAALAPLGFILLLGRVLSGIGSAFAFGTVTAVLVSAFPPERRGFILGVNVASTYLGLSIGPLLGGLVVQTLGWRMLFGSSATVGALVFFGALWALRQNDRQEHGGRIDLPGMALYGLGLFLLIWGLSLLPGLLGLCAAPAGLVLLLVFLWRQARVPHPVFPMGLFLKNRVFGFGNLAAMVNYSATFSVSYFMSIYLQVLRGLSPVQSGLILAVQTLVQALLSPLAGHLSDRISPRILSSTGLGISACSLAALVLLDQGTSLVLPVATLAVLGLGLALFSTPNNNSVLAAAGHRHVGTASTTIANMRIVGQILSMGMSLGLISAFVGNVPSSQMPPEPFLVALRLGFGLAGALNVFGMVISLARGPAEGPGRQFTVQEQ